MNELQVFENLEFGKIRTVVLSGKPYAVGVDVARALEYAKPSQAVIDHCKGIRKLGIPSEGGNQETNVIPEGDIYRLIVKASSQSRSKEVKAKAEHFESWIFDEVLPEIRRTGSCGKSGKRKYIKTQPWSEFRKEQKQLMESIDRIGGTTLDRMKIQMIRAFNVAHNLSSEYLDVLETELDAAAASNPRQATLNSFFQDVLQMIESGEIDAREYLLVKTMTSKKLRGQRVLLVWLRGLIDQWSIRKYRGHAENDRLFCDIRAYLDEQIYFSGYLTGYRALLGGKLRRPHAIIIERAPDVIKKLLEF
jgi:prophage antirepressor-like protein